MSDNTSITSICIQAFQDLKKTQDGDGYALLLGERQFLLTEIGLHFKIVEGTCNKSLRKKQVGSQKCQTNKIE